MGCPSRNLKKWLKWWDFLLNSLVVLRHVTCGQERICALCKTAGSTEPKQAVMATDQAH